MNRYLADVLEAHRLAEGLCGRTWHGPLGLLVPGGSAGDLLLSLTRADLGSGERRMGLVSTTVSAHQWRVVSGAEAPATAPLAWSPPHPTATFRLATVGRDGRALILYEVASPG